jgi:cytosine/adenosine deaminase-related metal-dependent hydrolase
MRIVFQNATVVNAGSVKEGCTVVVDRGKLARVERKGSVRRGRATHLLDAGNWLLFPALINIHEHLVGTWLPRCGNGPYENVYQWLQELHAKPKSKFATARERNLISKPNVYMMGAYKNLFSGVTTVVDHYVRLDRSVYARLPIRLVTNFGREWVVRTYREPDLYPSWGDGIVEEFKRCEGKRPFVIHVEEGIDEETGTELRRLERLGVLAPNSILIHGIGFDQEDIRIVARRKCHMVWCPATHEFLYGRTGNVHEWLKRGINTTLGTDSSLTGGLHLLDEMRTAHRVYRELFGQDLAPEELFKMVTVNPARALGLSRKLGRIARGYSADLLVLEKRPGKSPFETLLAAVPGDIVLLLQAGSPRYGNAALAPLFKADTTCGVSTPVTVAGKSKRVVGDPKRLLRAVWKEIGRRYHPAFLPFDANSVGPKSKR